MRDNYYKQFSFVPLSFKFSRFFTEAKRAAMFLSQACVSVRILYMVVYAEST